MMYGDEFVEKRNLKLNAVLNTIKTIFGILFPLITFPYVSRVLLPENIGKVNFGTSFVSYFSLIASLGITTYAIRECSAKRNNKETLSQTASQIFSINMCTTIIAYFLMIIALVVFKNISAYRTIIIIQSTAILFTTLGCDWLNSAMEDFAFITIRTIAFQIISLILMFMFVKNTDDYIKYAAITVLSSSGANFVNIFYRKKYCQIRFVTNMNIKKHIKPILLLFVMILAQTIFNSSDITMLGLIKGDYEVGLYTTAVKMSNLISQIVSSMAWVIMPRMALYFEQEDYAKINQMLKKVLSVLVTLGLPCAVGCMCLSKEIIQIIAGDQYLGATVALDILMIGFVISLVGGSFLGNMVLLPSKREGIYMTICCIATGVNLLLNAILIPKGGVNAAAFTTTLASLLIMVMLIITKDSRIKLEYFGQVVFAPVVGCTIMGVLCIFLRFFISNVFVKTGVCVFACAAVYIISQIILKNEIVVEMLSAILKKVRRTR